MSEGATSRSGIDFAQDLRRIREARGVSLEALHEETKIPLSLLEEFERTGLFDHPMFNRVYLRSLIRAYADMINIPTASALAALDEALERTYRGRLRSEILGEPVEPPPEPSGEAALRGGGPSPGEEEPEQPESEEASVPPEQTGVPPVGTPPAPASWETTSPPGAVPRKPQAGAGGKKGRPEPSSATTSRRWQPKDFRAQRSTRQWGLAVAVIVVLGLVIWGVIALVDRPEGEPEPVRPVAATDTATTEAVVEEPAPRRQVTLGDTMDVTVVAERGKVQPILIQRDEDLRRPYWIEEGQAKRFPAVDRIILEQELDVIRLLLEGYEYPTDRRDERGRIVITRDTAQAFLDTVSGQPVELPLEPQVVRKGPIPAQ